MACGAIGSPLFVIIFLIEGAARAGYNPIRHPISSLSIGESGWIQIASFMLSGSLIVAFAFGLGVVLNPKRSVWIPRLIGAVGIGLIGAGIFSSDPLYGYPASLPLAVAQYTVHGHLHDLFSIFVFVCLPLACFKFFKRFKNMGEHGWAAYSRFTGIAMLLAFILAGIGFKQVPGLVRIAGALQRLTIIIGFTWITLVALYLRRRSRLTN